MRTNREHDRQAISRRENSILRLVCADEVIAAMIAA
jgi:hypothetical protein